MASPAMLWTSFPAVNLHEFYPAGMMAPGQTGWRASPKTAAMRKQVLADRKPPDRLHMTGSAKNGIGRFSQGELTSLHKSGKIFF